MAAAGEYAGTQGLGLLRLHSTYRHDLKIYASDEGRVQMTAAAFAKGGRRDGATGARRRGGGYVRVGGAEFWKLGKPRGDELGLSRRILGLKLVAELMRD